jgi:RNA polymerase sigma factor (sigma-70 family)
MQNKDDWYYIRKVLDGEPAAFEPLVEKYKKLAYNISLKLVRQPEDAEEITQDAFVKAYRSLKGFKGDAKFSTWLYRIVYNSSVSHLRKKQRMVLETGEEKEMLRLADSGPGDQGEEMMSIALKKALDELPAEEQTMITLYYYQDNSIDEIAEIMGLTVSNVKVRLFRTRHKLHDLMQQLIKNEMLTDL